MSEPITDGAARRIASEWHAGQSSANYAFASSGAILPGLAGEIRKDLAMVERSATWEKQDGEDLRALLAYVESHGLRGPIENWHLVFFDTDAAARSQAKPAPRQSI